MSLDMVKNLDFFSIFAVRHKDINIGHGFT
jgi:hypothetical protein